MLEIRFDIISSGTLPKHEQSGQFSYVSEIHLLFESVVITLARITVQTPRLVFNCTTILRNAHSKKGICTNLRVWYNGYLCIIVCTWRHSVSQKIKYTRCQCFWLELMEPWAWCWMQKNQVPTLYGCVCKRFRSITTVIISKNMWVYITEFYCTPWNKHWVEWEPECTTKKLVKGILLQNQKINMQKKVEACEWV